LHPRRLGTEWRVALIVSVLAVAAVLLDLTPLLRGPAPYPPEWRWDLRAGPTSGRWPAVLATVSALVALAGLTSTGGRRRPAIVVAAAVAVGWMFQLSLVGLEAAGAPRTLMERALSRTATSYLTVAESDAARDPASFLDRHADLLPEMRKAAKHAATHPPGPVLFYRGLIGAFEAAPPAASALLAAAGIDLDTGRRSAPVRAAALAGPLLIMLMGAAAAWPVAALGRAGGLDAPRAARLAVLWPLLPGPALMAPHFDQMLALPVTAAAALLASASSSAGRPLIVRALAAGLCAGIAMQVSYGAAAFLAIAGAAALALAGRAASRAAVPAVAWAAGACALVILLPVAWGHEPIAAARTALAIHREAYTQPRSYATWLLFNPVDLAVFAGLPVVVVGLVRLARPPRPRAPFDLMRVALAAGLALLLLSGTVRGEIGRIAIPLMPALLVAALGPRGDPAVSPGPTAGEAALTAVLLAALTVAIAARWAVA
jgi:hypothetical protein